MEETGTTTVYYNSACPVCDAGIAAQQGRMASCNVVWVDVHKNPQAVQELGTDLESVRQRLYLRDEWGQIHVGANAFAQLWLRTPGQVWLGKLIQWPLVSWAGKLAYDLFSKALYRWNLWKKHW